MRWIWGARPACSRIRTPLHVGKQTSACTACVITALLCVGSMDQEKIAGETQSVGSSRHQRLQLPLRLHKSSANGQRHEDGVRKAWCEYRSRRSSSSAFLATSPSNNMRSIKACRQGAQAQACECIVLAHRSALPAWQCYPVPGPLQGVEACSYANAPPHTCSVVNFASGRKYEHTTRRISSP